MDPLDFLGLAESLVEGPSAGPAVFRTVIGRSYYAAFNVVAALTHEANIRLDKSKDSHREVLDIVADSNNPILKKACESLARQKMIRARADYEMNDVEVETRIKASRAVIFAKETIKQVDQVRSNKESWRQAKENMVACAKARGKEV
jgi:uncharacterized protein (UPF0332 family)